MSSAKGAYASGISPARRDTGELRQKHFQSPPSMEHSCLYRVDGAIHGRGYFLAGMAKVVGEFNDDPLLCRQPR
jgi:hypothetical protein